jgi:hypothetical protein
LEDIQKQKIEKSSYQGSQRMAESKALIDFIIQHGLIMPAVFGDLSALSSCVGQNTFTPFGS